MPHPLESGTIRILKPDGSTAGTGFLVSRRLAVTCVHVIESALVKPGQEIKFEYHLKDPQTKERQIGTAIVLEKGWSKENDIAVLELRETPPKGIKPLVLQCSGGSEGSKFLGLGYPDEGPVQARWAEGTITGRVDVVDYVNPVLQLQGELIDQGLSGCAIVESTSRRVIGMLSAYRDLVARSASSPKVRIAYSIPTESIWETYPAIKEEPEQRRPYAPLLDGIDQLPYDYARRIQTFLTDYLGRPNQPKPFGGREDAFRILNSWLESDSQHLLLVAPAGRGKSALLVRWVDSLMARDDLAIAFVPVSVRYRTNLTSAFFASLAARLAYLHGDPVPISAETSTDVYYGLVERYISTSLSNDKTLLVVLDGLDEAADWEAALDLIPSDLPQNVRVVISARFLAGDTDSKPWLSRLGWKRQGMASTLELALLDPNGVSDVLRRMGFPLNALSRRVNIVAELHRLSEGDPLLVNLYVEDLWSQGEGAARLEPEDLRDIKPGLEGYFERWWEDQKKLWGGNALNREKDTKLVFNLLCSAMGPLTKNDLLSLAPEKQLDTYLLEEAIDILKRFVVGIPDERKDEVGYVFSHPKFRDYFWKKLSKWEQMDLEKCFLDWGEETLNHMIIGSINPKLKEDVPVYIVQYYTEHLKRSEQPIEKYLPLIHHPYWEQAWFTVEGAYGGYLKDVQCVWNKCKELDRSAIERKDLAPYFGEQIRCALIEASLHSLAGNIPPKLIALLKRERVWTLPQIWVYIRQIPSAAQQEMAILSLLRYLTTEQFPEALEAARAIQDEEARAQVLSVLAEHLPEVIGEALEAAQAIQAEWARARVLSALAEHLPERELGQILKAARMIQDEGARAQVLSALAEHLPERELGHVLDVARAIRNEKIRARVLCVLAEHRPEVISESLEAARGLQDEMECAKILSSLAGHMLEKELGQILEAAHVLRDERIRAWVLNALARRLPEKELRQVLDAARAIQDEKVRVRVLTVLAERLPEVMGEALEAARTILHDVDRAWVLSTLAEHRPEVTREALDAARTIQDERTRADMLIALAKHWPEIMREALEAVRAIQDEEERAHALSALAEHLPERELGQALETARAIQDEEDRAWVLSALAGHRPEVMEEALEAARAIQNERTRTDVLVVLAEHQPDVIGEALEAARAIQDEEDRAWVLSALVEHLPERDLKQILDAARVIRDKKDRTWVLSALAEHRPEVIDEALEAARAIQDEEDRAWVLSVLVERRPEVMEEALEAARAIQNERTRADVLIVLAKHRPEVIDEALEAARAIQHEASRADVLTALAERRPEVIGEILQAARGDMSGWDQINVLSTLAGHLPERDLKQVLEAARAIQYDWVRARVLGALADHLPEIVDEALKEARAIQDEGERTHVLSALVRHLPEIEQEQILEAARTIQDKEERAQILSALAEYLPEVIDEALQAAQAIQHEAARARVLSDLAEHRSEVIAEALETAGVIQNEWDRINVLRALVPPLFDISIDKLYGIVEVTLPMLSLRSRSDLFSDIAVLLRILLRLGKKKLGSEILQAVRDVSDWWR